MKLASFAYEGRQSYGVVIGDAIIDIGRRLEGQCPSLRAAIASLGRDGLGRMAERSSADLALGAVTLLPPIPDPDKIICIGLNYRDHAREAGMKIPENMSLFSRLTNTLVGHAAPMLWPKVSRDFDYEGELGVIISRAGRHIAERDALDHVFGYTCFNDGSIRDYQLKHSVTAGKNFPATGGCGPWIVTADEIPDPSRLTLTTRVNGHVVQHKGTDDMIFGVPAIVEYLSRWTMLRPGDLIATGTPEGVGFARKPPLWLKPGDVVEVEISGIGVLRNPIAAEA